MRHRIRHLAGDESGAVLVLLAVVMAVLLVATALVIDIAAVRTLRINQQSISDAAAAAGALTAGEGGSPRAVCPTAPTGSTNPGPASDPPTPASPRWFRTA